MAAGEKNKQRLTKEVKAKEIADNVQQDNQAEYAAEFPLHQPEKGMNKKQHRQKKQ